MKELNKISSKIIRQKWLDFFKSKGHEIVPSASLIPHNDPTLLWINSGVAPLKKYFDGREIPKNRRLVNAQKAIRTNDIDNVGKTARHHTFFEMLGNFSIGDYFRDDALTWAIEILTSPQWFNLPLDKLYFTIYPDDVESFNKWKELGVTEDHIIKLEGNFWEIGEGPCGPDTEIFYDRGEKYDENHIGLDLLKKDIENDRYIEIWNIVFSQFNAKSDRKRSEYEELPSKNIDTGMGFERIVCIIQEAETNYETDLFMPLINKISAITNVPYNGQMAFKVIADHIRSVTFAISDGAMFSNEGRGYVLRRVLRRAIRYGKKLGMKKPFIYSLVDIVCECMGDFYTYLHDTCENVKMVVKTEEEKFLATLEAGEKRLIDYIENAKEKVIEKEIAFLLYDTFGFPLELTLEVASEYGFTVDEEGFKAELKRQKETSRNARDDSQSMNIQNPDFLDFTEKSLFVGYTTPIADAKIIALFKDGQAVNETEEDCLAVFSKTPFYAESGGQAGDQGTLEAKNSVMPIINTIKLPNNQPASFIKASGEKLYVGMDVHLIVDENLRNNTSANHSATHLLNDALRKVLGGHVHQQGSSVNDNLLRFDFNNFTFPSNEEIVKIEKIVNDVINEKIAVVIKEMEYEKTKDLNIQALFTEKYDDIVRVVKIGDSLELCGGTHVANTEEIEQFAITSIESKGSGIFRIEAATKDEIKHQLEIVTLTLKNEIADLKNKANDIVTKAKEENITLPNLTFDEVQFVPSYQYVINIRKSVALLREDVKELEKRYQKLKKDQVTLSLDDYEKYLETKGNINFFIFKTKNIVVDATKDLADRLSDKYDNSFVFIANIVNDKVIFICKSKIATLHAGMLVKEAAILTGGNGGGRADFAQAGGKNIANVDEALALVKAKLL